MTNLLYDVLRRQFVSLCYLAPVREEHLKEVLGSNGLGQQRALPADPLVDGLGEVFEEELLEQGRVVFSCADLEILRTVKLLGTERILEME